MDGQRDTPPPPAASCRRRSGSRNKLGMPVCNARRILYAVKHGMKVQLVTPYRVSLLQRYGVTVRGNVTSVHPP